MKPIKISESEWLVMGVAWAKAPVSAGEIVETLAGRTGWHPRTTRTLLDRLVKKKAIKIRPGGKPSLYEPLITMEAAVRQESRSFLRRVFGGEPGPMLLHLVEEANLSPEEIERLKILLSEKEK